MTRTGFDSYKRPHEYRGGTERITQQGIQPTATRRRHQLAGEREYKAIVGKSGESDFGDLQSAIDFVNNLDGGRIFIKKGTYSLHGNLILYSNIHLLGQDQNNTIINFQSNRKGIRATGTSGTHKENIILENFTVKNSIDWELGVIDFDYVDNFYIGKIRLIDNFDKIEDVGSGIQIDNCTNGIVEKNYANNSDLVIIGGTNSEITIFNNLAESSYGTPFIFGGAATDNVIFIANTVDNPGGDAFRIDGVGAQFIANRAENCTVDGISLFNTSDKNIITNNFLSAGAGAGNGIEHTNNTQTADNNNISNNILIGTWAIGIYLVNSDNNIVIGNNIPSSTVGIELTNTCDRNIVSANHLKGCTTPLTNNGTNTETGGGNITA